MQRFSFDTDCSNRLIDILIINTLRVFNLETDKTLEIASESPVRLAIREKFRRFDSTILSAVTLGCFLHPSNTFRHDYLESYRGQTHEKTI